jgi:hypothetical protein
VLFLCADDFPAGIQAAWEQLESRFDSLRGRRFFGSFDSETSEYRACVRAEPGDDPAALGLERAVLPGGRYVRVRLRGEPLEVYERIPATFAELGRRADADPSRPSLEFYRRRDEIDLLLPVA